MCVSVCVHTCRTVCMCFLLPLLSSFLSAHSLVVITGTRREHKSFKNDLPGSSTSVECTATAHKPKKTSAYRSTGGPAIAQAEERLSGNWEGCWFDSRLHLVVSTCRGLPLSKAPPNPNCSWRVGRYSTLHGWHREAIWIKALYKPNTFCTYHLSRNTCLHTVFKGLPKAFLLY